MEKPVGYDPTITGSSPVKDIRLRSSMERTKGFYPFDMGSIPVGDIRAIGIWCNGSIIVSKTIGKGSNPLVPVKLFLGGYASG